MHIEVSFTDEEVLDPLFVRRAIRLCKKIHVFNTFLNTIIDTAIADGVLDIDTFDS